MTTPEDPAFPTEQVTRHIGAPGMTLEQYAAIQFMAAAIAREGFARDPEYHAADARRYAAGLFQD